jgi:hypothetical protein
MSTTLNEMLTTSQAATLLGRTPQRVIQLARAGRLAFIETPHGRLFDPASVAALAAERHRERRRRPAKPEEAA